MNLDRLTKILTRHEGLRLKPYTDTVGKLTIGIGRNLDDRGITETEARFLLATDINLARENALSVFPQFHKYTPARQEAIINMIFNLGITRFKRFKNMIGAILRDDWSTAAWESLDSHWARQVGQRAQDISHALRHGEWAE